MSFYIQHNYLVCAILRYISTADQSDVMHLSVELELVDITVNTRFPYEKRWLTEGKVAMQGLISDMVLLLCGQLQNSDL